MGLVINSGCGFGIDVGYGRPIELSSIFNELANPFQLLPAGIPGGYSLHTEFEQDPFVIVDLESIRVVKRIRVFNRENFFDRAVPMVISTAQEKGSWREICRVDYPFGGRTVGTPLDISFEGDHPRIRFLKLQVQKLTYLNLDYIEILAPTPDMNLATLQKIDTSGPHILAEYHHHDSFGFSWTFTLTLGTIIWCLGYHIVISGINYSKCLAHFKDRPGFDLYPYLFSAKQITEKIKGLGPVGFTQHGIYAHYKLAELHDYAKIYFWPSSLVLVLEYRLIEKYAINPSRCIALIYRGTDKDREVSPVSIAQYIAVAIAARRVHPDLQVLIQTDQEQALNAVLEAIPDAIFFGELPVTAGSKVIHELDLGAEFNISRSEFAARMLAVTHLMSTMKYVVSHTGNIGLWIAIYRGKADGFYQFDTDQKLRDPKGNVIEDLENVPID